MSQPTTFLIVSDGRTGSNLLRDLIASHPHAFCGGEIFNKDYVERNGVPWPVGDTEKDNTLIPLMRDNPEEYLARLFAQAATKGFRAIGAKLTFENGAAHPTASMCLAAKENLRVIHLRRCNVLRQYVSLQRAFKTGEWAAKGNSGPLPRIHIDFVKFVWFLLRNKELEAKAHELFAKHPSMQVTYEDLAAAPQAVSARCVEFLGLDPNVPLRTWHRKSATDSLRDAIENYDEVKARFREWFGYFED